MGTPPLHDCRFTVWVEDGKDETRELEKNPVDVPDYDVYSSADYPPTRVDGGISLETLERQCMLLFPTTSRSRVVEGGAGAGGGATDAQGSG